MPEEVTGSTVGYIGATPCIGNWISQRNAEALANLEKAGN
jgi:hypothetical protein